MRRSLLGAVLTAAVSVGIAACAHPERVPAVPEELTDVAEIPGIPGVRYRADDVDLLLADALQAEARHMAWRTANGETGLAPADNYLVVSGGSDNGAFGAGLLVGWSQAGTRPEFALVTGTSTGALTAPFAFLGPDYDDELKEVYTTISAEDVLTRRGFLAAFNNDAMADSQPLWRLISRYADADLLEAIAREHGKGRMLLVATTDLDARTGVIWNMGKIAASGHSDALNLFRNVLIASAAIPGAFPPVMIDVEVDGVPYQEMHVDGGVMAQLFLYPTSLDTLEAARQYGVEERAARFYIVRNARLDPDWASVRRRTISISGRSISTLIQTQGCANLYWLYTIAQRDDIEYNLAFIGPEFDADKPGQFDTAYMNALFDYGYALGKTGYRWSKAPPSFPGAVDADPD